VKLRLREWGRAEYLPVWQAMREFTATRDPSTADELWCVEHSPVYTLGRAGRREHLHAPGAIPVVASDRGGQVTYHGPGQLVVYTLLDLARLGLGPRELVRRLEAGILDCLAHFGIAAERRPGAPGVYVGGAKIAALGLRIRNGCSYHGIALNVAMDLAPWTRIDPCGYAGLRVTHMAEAIPGVTMSEVQRVCVACLVSALYGARAPEIDTRAPLPDAVSAQ
jgi:lipoyl(octanoyl) transferase